jgi:hypothetical protein
LTLVFDRFGIRVFRTDDGSEVTSGQWPGSLQRAQSLYEAAKRRYDQAVSDAATQVAWAKADMDRMTMFPIVDPFAGWSFYGGAPTTVADGVPSLRYEDPTWTALTGGGVFKPDAPGQFEGWANNNRLLPSWYEPTESNDLGEHIRLWLKRTSFGIEVAAIVVAIVAPEALPEVAGLYVMTKSGQVITDLAAGDKREALLDGADIVLAGAGLQNLTALVATKAGVTEYSTEVAKKTTEFIQGRIKEVATTTPKGELKVAASDLQEIVNEARSRATVLGLEQTSADKQMLQPNG